MLGLKKFSVCKGMEIWYTGGMSTTDLKTVLERAATWPEEDQQELIEAAREIEGRHSGLYELSSEERAGIERGLAEMRGGKFASDEDVAAIFRKARSSAA